jgi:PAS domain S-box-containing protein
MVGTLAGHCASTGEALVSNDVLADSRVDVETCRRLGMHAVVLVPLRAQGRSVGVMVVYAERRHAFTALDVHTVELLAGFLGSALDATIQQQEHAALREQIAAVEATVVERTEALRRANAELAALADEAARQRNFLANLLDQLPGGVALFDLNLDIQLANPAFAAPFGKRPDYFIGRHLFEALPDSEGHVEPMLKEVLKTGVPYTATSFPFRYHTPDGIHETFWDFTWFPMRNVWGEVDSILVHCVEVTPRVALEKQVEAHARQIERDKTFLETVLHNLPAGIFIVDTDHRYIWANEAVARMVGVPQAALLGRDLYDLVPTAARPNPRLCEVFATGEVASYAEVLLPLAGDGPHYYDLTYVPLKQDGEVRSVMIASVDVTARVESERIQAAQVEALRHAAAIKDEFLAIASHELRTPLTVIRNAANILTKGYAGALRDEQASFVQTIARTVTHLSRLVDDLLDLQKLESGEMPYRMEPGDLGKVLREVACGFAVVADEQRLRFDVQLPSFPVCMRFDADRMAQLVLNLLSNAAKFTPAGGAIALTLEPGDDEVRISVVDTGIGIAEADLNRIFDKFVQVEHSLQRKAGGTGLGLPIVQRIVEDVHGGRLLVESRPGVGSRFTVVLPVS